MRAGGCAVQQALSAEAAAVVRQAVALARRRGHAQVTPLHVASAMLSAATGLLRAACLRSHSHPLQCKALELCFNVALNRLPTAGPAAAAAVMFHHHHHHGGGAHGQQQQHAPVLSNALVAAFKRAQAHQRRGGGAVDGGGQQGQPPPPQPVLAAAKVDIEQLIVSILDDPSVSRVMREAGFSSSQVKANVEKAVSSSSSSPEHQQPNNTTAIPPPINCNAGAGDGDAMRVLDCMASGAKRGVVVVGESAEAVVKAVMDRVSKGELQPRRRHERLRNLQFVPLSAAAFRRMAREDVDARAVEIRALVRQGSAAGKGVVLVLQDLAFAADAWAAAVSERRRSRGGCGGGGGVGGRDDDEHGDHCGGYYCPVEHAVMEVGSLVSAASAAAGGGRGLDRFWLLGFGNNQAYMKARAGQPSLEAVWELHPLVVPDGGGSGGGLSLSLTGDDSEAQQANQERATTRPCWPFASGGGGAATGESELIITSCAKVAPATAPSVPPWFQGYQVQDMTRPASRSTSFQLQDWNPNFNGSAPYHTSELTLSFSPQATTNSPDVSSISGSFATSSFNAASSLMMSSEPWQFKLMQPCRNYRHDDQNNALARVYDHQQLHGSWPSPEKSYSVTNSSEGNQAESPKFTELTAENLKILCNALENRAPHHKDVVTEIASAVLQCRSGMTRRRRWCQEKPSAVTWLLFQGEGNDGKKAVSQELARLVFGSYSKFTSISLADEFTHNVHSDSSSAAEPMLKRQRSLDTRRGYVQRLYDAILKNPHRVIMINGVEQLDCESEIGIRNAITNGRIRGCNGGDISFGDAIIVLSCEAPDSMSNASSPRIKQRAINKDGKEGNGVSIEKGMESPSGFNLDLNECAEDSEENYEESVSDNVRIINIVDGVFVFQLMEHS